MERTELLRAVDLTPVEDLGGIILKRDDTFSLDGQCGGKVRTCLRLAVSGLRECPNPRLVTAGSRHSPQVAIVAAVAKRLKVPARVHVPAGDSTPELEYAASRGAEIVRHRPGHNSVIKARARDDAAASHAVHIPFGMETADAITGTARQVPNLVDNGRWQRLVVPVGSGMSLAGILHGLDAEGDSRPVLGVVVGADPTKRLDRYAPPFWRQRVTLVPAGIGYHQHVAASIGGLSLDPVYEAKCSMHLQPGDALWIVGRRAEVETCP